jgi:hypothetical protein
VENKHARDKESKKDQMKQHRKRHDNKQGTTKNRKRQNQPKSSNNLSIHRKIKNDENSEESK